MKNTLILAWVGFKPHLVGVIIEGMKNKGEKRGEKKKRFVVVWLTVENGKDLVGPKSFLLGPTKTQYPQIGEKIIEKYLYKNA